MERNVSNLPIGGELAFPLKPLSLNADILKTKVSSSASSPEACGEMWYYVNPPLLNHPLTERLYLYLTHTPLHSLTHSITNSLPHSPQSHKIEGLQLSQFAMGRLESRS